MFDAFPCLVNIDGKPLMTFIDVTVLYDTEKDARILVFLLANKFSNLWLTLAVRKALRLVQQKI